MRTWTDRPVVRTLLAVAASVALLSACQTGTEPDDDTDGPTAEQPGEPTDPDGSEEPDDGDSGDPDDSGDDDGPGTVNGPNSITAPEPGQTVAGPDVTVTGEGTAFEATLNYRVLVAGTEDVVAGPDYTMAGANGEVGPYTIDLSLDPGEYTVQVWEPDMAAEDGESGELINLVEVTFTVS